MDLTFPSEFTFGVATSAYQVEGGIENDWSEWERLGKLKDPAARCGRAVDHWGRFDEDLSLITGLGATAYRLSIEWARLEPKPGEWSDEALHGYRRRLEALVARGIRPVVTLHHFTHPTWFHSQTPWHEPSSLVAWQRYVTRCADLLEGLDAAIITLNEPGPLLLGGYLSAQIPPGLADGAKAFAAFANLARAHVLARQAFVDRARGKPVEIGISHNMMIFAPARRWHPWDHALTRLGDVAYNTAFLEGLHTGQLRMRMPGVLSGTATIDGAVGSMSFLGMNYYTRAHLKFMTKAPFLDFTFKDVHARGLTDIGWEWYHEGFGQLLRRLKPFGLPVWVTENGLDDRTGQRRAQFLYEHWQQLLAARADGVNVTTYLHWSLLDNFEWLESWGPRFGLYRVDFDTLARTPTPAVDYFRRVATSRVLTAP